MMMTGRSEEVFEVYLRVLSLGIERALVKAACTTCSG